MLGLKHYLVTPLAYTGAAGAFTYHSDDPLTEGAIVQVPVGRRELIGIVTGAVTKPDFATKPVIGKLEFPPVPADLLELAQWMAGYYAASPASIWTTMLPTGLNRNRRTKPQPEPSAPAGLPSDPLTFAQSAILEAFRQSGQTTHLLHGVTGSGKTRVYLELAAEALAAGRSVIILIPEITLTPQMVGQFETAFGDRVLASHSKLKETERAHIWNAAATAAAAGEPRVIVGPRSCLFLPTSQLGLIVVDECHEATYKQEQNPRYQALSTAAKRAHINGAKLLLGSATPGVAELYLAQQNRIRLLKLLQRVNEIPHEVAKIYDLRDKQLLSSSKFITQPIIDAVAVGIDSGRQSLLYINRRGSASSQVCSNCGHVTMCPLCQLPLTFHADLLRLICHHCNYRVANPAVCPECGASELRLLGGGTKRIEAEVERLFPGARVARLDRDSATLTHIKQVFQGLRRGEIDILVGTQMIAKGLDLPAIDTVGIINADTMLHLPDFTAAERTYQLLTQVAGRAGRGDRPGQVFIQTYSPNHPAIRAAATADYAGFAEAELAQRQLLGYPPFVFLLKLTVTAKTREAALEEATALARKLSANQALAVVGPAPAFLELQGGTSHWVLTVKSKHRPPLVEIARSLPPARWAADLDPINLL